MTYRVPHRIETQRLVLRRYAESDAEALAAVVGQNSEHLRRYMEWIQFEPQSVEQRRAWIAAVNAKWDAGTDYTMGIFLRGDVDEPGEFIGGTGFHTRRDPDRLAVGYWIAAAHEGVGLVSETSAALTRVALELTGADIADISHAPSNTRSASVPERLGYVRQEFSGEECFDAGETLDAVTWFATREHLDRDPLASIPRPRAFDADGRELAWPA